MSDDGQDGSDASEEERSPLAQAWDIARYAPIGLLFDGPSFLPKLAELGKERVSNARAVGELAVRQLTEQLRERLELDGADESPDDDAERPAVDAAPVRRARRTERRPPPPPDPSAPKPEELAIEDYESLSASQVVSRLPGLAPEELEAVRRFEAAHRGRKTILNRAAQLGAGN